MKSICADIGILYLIKFFSHFSDDFCILHISKHLYSDSTCGKIDFIVNLYLILNNQPNLITIEYLNKIIWVSCSSQIFH